MNTRFASLKKHNLRGGALIIVLFTVVTLGGIVGLALNATSQNSRLAARQRTTARITAAADGALEFAFAQWRSAYSATGKNNPTGAELIATGMLNPTVDLHPGFAADGITISDFSIVALDHLQNSLAQTAEPGAVRAALVPGMPGRSGTARLYRASVRITAPTPIGTTMSVLARRVFQVTEVPIFQHLVFSEDELDILATQNMYFNGPVHTNSNIWAAAADRLQFFDYVTYSGTYNEAEHNAEYGNPISGRPDTPYWRDGLQSPQNYPTNQASTAPSATKDLQLHRSSRMELFGTAATELFSKDDTNPNNDSPRELIEPPDSAESDPPQIARQRYFNKAMSGGITIQLDTAQLSTDPASLRVWDRGSEVFKGDALYDSVKGSLPGQVDNYDWREEDTISVNRVDLRLLDTTLKNRTFNGVVYIHDVNPYDRTALRFERGTIFNRDYTFVSQNPVYTKGDINTGDDNPANVPSSNNGNTTTGSDQPHKTGYTMRSVAFVSDAHTVLSRLWDDADTELNVSARTATHTTVNAAVFTGWIPTDTAAGKDPSGGVRNILRLMERWSNRDLTFTGSLVQGYTSEQFTGLWGKSNVYNSPRRRLYNFPQNLATTPPPGSPVLTTFSRGRWEALGD